ncbi:hypothetical protein U1872_06270 [Sphingomonas sp. RB3P16]|uniref:hypothetical protein n=1 Tax=Parasphingomonas frigoris TaxID=3096163 RepID=UPI002FC7CEE2
MIWAMLSAFGVGWWSADLVRIATAKPAPSDIWYTQADRQPRAIALSATMLALSVASLWMTWPQS